MYKVRIHSRGGQGGRATSHILGTAAFLDNKYAQDFALYGAERRGAPLTAFCRIDDKPVLERGYIQKPDCVLVFDDSLLGMKEVHAFDGLAKKGLVIVNTKKKLGQVGAPRGAKVYTFDATAIAMKTIKRDLPGGIMLGALSKLTGVISLDSIYRAIEKVLKQRHADLINSNIMAVKEGHNLVKK